MLTCDTYELKSSGGDWTISGREQSVELLLRLNDRPVNVRSLRSVNRIKKEEKNDESFNEKKMNRRKYQQKKL